MTITYSRKNRDLALPTIEKPNKPRLIVFDKEEEEGKPAAKATHELQEAGENSRFMDDLDYILDGLSCNSPISVRRSSAFELANKCVSQVGFATKVRALGYTAKIISSFIFAVKPMENMDTEYVLILLHIFTTLFSQIRKLELGEQSAEFFDCLLRLMRLKPNLEISSVELMLT